MSTPTEPIDSLHRSCMDARFAIRAHAQVLHGYVESWELRPMPEDWYPEPRPERNESRGA